MTALTEHEWNILFREKLFFSQEANVWITAVREFGSVNILAILRLERMFLSMDGYNIYDALDNHTRLVTASMLLHFFVSIFAVNINFSTKRDRDQIGFWKSSDQRPSILAMVFEKIY